MNLATPVVVRPAATLIGVMIPAITVRMVVTGEVVGTVVTAIAAETDMIAETGKMGETRTGGIVMTVAAGMPAGTIAGAAQADGTVRIVAAVAAVIIGMTTTTAGIAEGDATTNIGIAVTAVTAGATGVAGIAQTDVMAGTEFGAMTAAVRRANRIVGVIRRMVMNTSLPILTLAFNGSMLPLLRRGSGSNNQKTELRRGCGASRRRRG